MVMSGGSVDVEASPARLSSVFSLANLTCVQHTQAITNDSKLLPRHTDTRPLLWLLFCICDQLAAFMLLIMLLTFMRISHCQSSARNPIGKKE